MKSPNQVVLASFLVIFLTGTTTAISLKPQPLDKSIRTTEGQLPPEVFPKVDTNDSIEHLLDAEKPRKLFPDDKALAKSHADITSKGKSENDLVKQNNTKITKNDDTSNETSEEGKKEKVASEIPDLLNTDFMNMTTYENGTESTINNDTEIVNGPHVVNENKTHDEDASSALKNCSLNETTEENNSTLKTGCVIDSTTNKTNETTEEVSSNNKNDSSIEVTTEAEVKQNSTLNNTTEDVIETTKSLNNSTDEGHENITGVSEPKVVVNSSTTLEYNTTIPTTENSTAVTATKYDNSTEAKEVVTPGGNDTEQTSTGSTVTELSSAKAENTSVNISENIIDHKADSPVALAASQQQHGDHSHSSSGKSSAFLQPTESAAILAGVFVAIALVGYVGLLIWRRILEKRYGNREMLVNEDDFYDTNDLRNFEL